MAEYKERITLNEKNSLIDLLLLEKQAVKLYATALTEGCSAQFRECVKGCLNASIETQFKVFLTMTDNGYYRVHTASEEQTQKLSTAFKETNKEFNA